MRDFILSVEFGHVFSSASLSLMLTQMPVSGVASRTSRASSLKFLLLAPG
jgi:hypothetical protein